MATMKEQGYVYLVIVREFRRRGVPFAFKVGRSQSLLQRIADYPPGSLLIGAVPVAGTGKVAEDDLSLQGADGCLPPL